jgi:hypothetical protein
VNIDKWKLLSEEDQMLKAKHLNPYEEWDLFKSIENELTEYMGNDLGILKIFCGICGTVGGLNAISVQIKRGGSNKKIPKYFLGFQVLKSYASKSA